MRYRLERYDESRRWWLMKAYVRHPVRFLGSDLRALGRWARRRSPFRRGQRMCRWRCMYVGVEEVCPVDGYWTTPISPDGWARELWEHFHG